MIEEVSDWLDVDPDRLRLFQEREALGKDAGLPPPMFYASRRGGAPGAPDDLARGAGPRAAHDDPRRPPTASSTANVGCDATVDRLADYVVERALRADRTPARSWPRCWPRPICRPKRSRACCAGTRRAPATRPSSGSRSREDAESSGGLDPAAAREVREAVRVGEMLGPDIPVLQCTYAWRREGRWNTPEDLAESASTTGATCSRTSSGSTPARKMRRRGRGSEEERRERIEARAEAILDTLEETFPSEFIRDRLAESEDIGAPRASCSSARPTTTFSARSIRARIADDPELARRTRRGRGGSGHRGSGSGRAREPRDRSRRRSGGARRHRHAARPWRSRAIPRRQFIDLYGEALGGRAQASRVHAQAQQTAAGSKLARSACCRRCSGCRSCWARRRRLRSRAVPDARTLFQAAGGFCDCEHCGSVYSPAAYFVDLLRYLNVSSPERIEQIEKRLDQSRNTAARIGKLSQLPAARRAARPAAGPRGPAAHVREHADALPYIDLVNELLEASDHRRQAPPSTPARRRPTCCARCRRTSRARPTRRCSRRSIR